MKVEEKVYLGNAVYARYDGNFVILTTENGITITNEIYLDIEVLNSLLKFLETK